MINTRKKLAIVSFYSRGDLRIIDWVNYQLVDLYVRACARGQLRTTLSPSPNSAYSSVTN